MIIRPVTADDKELVMGLRAQVSEIADAYRETPDFAEFSWEQDLSSTTEKLLLAFDNGTFIGMGTLQNLEGNYIEIGINIVPEKQGTGFGTALTEWLIRYCHRQYPDREIRMRARKENTASIRMIEKNGGVFIGEEDVPGTELLEWLIEACPEKREEYSELVMQRRNGVKVFRMPALDG